MSRKSSTAIPFCYRKKPGVKEITSIDDLIPLAMTERKVGNEEMKQEMTAASTITPADATAVLEGMKKFFYDHLSRGELVQIEGIGSFQVKLKGKAKQTANRRIIIPDLRVSGVQFRPAKPLLQAMQDSQFCEVAGASAVPPTAEEMLPAILEYLSTHSSITVPKLAKLKFISRERSRAILSTLVDSGQLRRIGSGPSTTYISI